MPMGMSASSFSALSGQLKRGSYILHHRHPMKQVVYQWIKSVHRYRQPTPSPSYDVPRLSPEEVLPHQHLHISKLGQG